MTALISEMFAPALVSGRRIGLFGGSFNPPHAGHRAIAEAAWKRLRLDEVWWLVNTRNPLKRPADTADLEQRLALTRKVAAHPRFRVLDLERRAGTIYTAELLARMAPLLEQGLFVWIMGADAFAGLHRWRDWRAIALRLPLAVFDRPGWTMKALHCPAALALRGARLPEREAALLAELAPPAWAFLTLPLREESSTRLRKAARQAAAQGTARARRAAAAGRA